MVTVRWDNVARQTCHGSGIPLELPVLKSHDLTVTSHVTNQVSYISTCIWPMSTKLGKLVSYLERFLPLKSSGPLITWPMWGHAKNWTNCFFTFTRLMTTKPGKVLTSGKKITMVYSTLKVWEEDFFRKEFFMGGQFFWAKFMGGCST